MQYATMKTELFFLSFLLVGLSRYQVNARGINISNVWFLPEEGFPVFYRYFNDKVTWNEAEALCGYHHADLLSVQTSAQMDAARAYLKEIDVTDNVWIGLQRGTQDKPFLWTNGEKLVGDGYWLQPIPKTNEKLCAALDPASDFRWNSYYCGGSQVSSFVCELPVPDWAKKEDGCMITSLPSLTVTFIPEMDIVQLFSDCGLDGTRRIACKGGVNREDMMKRLSCDEDVFASTMFSKSTTDTVKEAITQQSAWMNDLKATNRGVNNQAGKARILQTRHKRQVSSPPSQTTDKPDKERASTQAEAETSTQVTSTEKSNILKLPSRVFPHSPNERNVLSTLTPAVASSTSVEVIESSTKKAEKTMTPSTNHSNVPVLPPRLMVKHKVINAETTLKPTESVTQVPTIKANASDHLRRPPMQSAEKDVPVLIITSENVNESSSSNSTTSENPQIVFMIDEKEGFAEPYLVPMNGDVIVNNPSLSPMEVIDVDLIELDNLTTTTSATTTTTTTTNEETTKTVATSFAQTTITTPPKQVIGVHPLRLGEKNAVSQNATTTTPVTTVTTSTTTTTPPSTMSSITVPSSTATPVVTTTHKPTPASPVENFELMSQNNIGEPDNMPQRPNRGRLLTRSSNPSFYPYILNRVFG